jgi:hypothetical protein
MRLLPNPIRNKITTDLDPRVIDVWGEKGIKSCSIGFRYWYI